MTPSAVQLKFRVHEELRSKLEEAARQHGVSLNAEIVRRLAQSFKTDEVWEAYRTLEQERAETQRRCNQLTDYVLALTSPKVPAAQAVYGPGAQSAEDAA
jgi:hypothetical protein